jgi:hypothetical protein
MSAPPRATADRNLLFGILALQMDFIGRDDLITALNAWVLQKSKVLGQVLLERGKLAPPRLQLLEALVGEHLQAHQGDALFRDNRNWIARPSRHAPETGS